MDRDGFSFSFRHTYVDAVEKQLYGVKLYDLAAREHTFQYKSATRLVCLLCSERVQIPVDRSSLKHHLDGHVETTSVSQDAFDVYHKAFFGLAGDQQMQQIYFDPYDCTALHCEICSCFVAPAMLDAHIRSEHHCLQIQMNSAFYWNVPTANAVKSPEKEKDATIAKRSKVKKQPNGETIYTQLTPDELAAAEFTFAEVFQHQSANLITCLLCHRSVQKVQFHLQQKRHIQRSSSAALVDQVHEYHERWETSLEKYQAFQKYFVITDRFQYQCLLCRCDMMIAKVPKHIKKFPCNFLHPSNPMHDNTVNWKDLRAKYVAQKCPQLKYTENIISKFYSPSSIFHVALVTDELKMYTLQRRNCDESGRSGEIYCLICRQSIANFKENWECPKLTKTIGEHLANRTHTSNICNCASIKHLYSYHKFILQSSETIANMQDRLNPHNTNFMCANCKKPVKRKNVEEHLTGVNRCVSHLKQKSRSDLRRERRTERRKDRHDEAFEQLYIHKETANDFAHSANASNSRSVSQSSSTSTSSATEICEYDDETMLKLYSTCNTPNGHRRPPILTIQKRSDHEKFCLACTTTVSSNLREHLNGAKHEAAVHKAFEILKSYHAFWMAQDGDAQLEQVYFNPGGADCVKCATCNQKVPFASIPSHRCVLKIKQCKLNGAFAEEQRIFALAYDISIMRRLFYGMHYDISRDWLQSDMPIAYRARAYFNCLMCADRKSSNVRVFQDGCVWKRHILDCHTTASQARDRAIERVKLFHSFWMQQLPEKQIYLMYFTSHPRSIQTIVCSRGHVVDLAEGVQHIEKHCDVRNQQPQQVNNDDQPSVVKDYAFLADALHAMEQLQLPTTHHTQPPIDQEKKLAVTNPNGRPHKITPLMPAVQDPTGTRSIQTVLPRHLYADGCKFLRVLPNGNVACQACQLEMVNDMWTLRHHLGHDIHAKMTQSRISVNYYCEICNVLFARGLETKWLVHLQSPDHLLRLQKSGDRGKNVQEHLCITCNKIIFGDQISLILHRKRNDRHAKHKPGTLTIGMKELLNTRRKLEEKAKSLHKESAAVVERMTPKVKICLDALEDALQAVYPNCKIYEFGSRVTGFVTKDSDLDLFVDIEDNLYNASEHSSRGQQRIVVAVKKLLSAKPKIFGELHPIPMARVPILKVIHRASDIDCDLSFSNGLSVENTRLIKFFIDFDPIFFDVVLLLKEWGSLMQPPLKNDMTSYALTMMALFSMQVAGSMPSINQLREFSTYDVRNINGWDTLDLSQLRIDELRAIMKRPKNIADVVMEFFGSYAAFNYAADVVCPLLGRAFKVSQFTNDGAMLPSEMITYVVKVKGDPDSAFKSTSSMFVQDPFDLGHNLAKNVNKQFVNNFKALCQASFEHIDRK